MGDIIRVVLFDMDGVIIDARDWHYEALNDALAHFGHDKISYPDHLKHFDGLPTRQKLIILNKEKNVPTEQFDDISAFKQRCTIDLMREKCRPIAACTELLQRLKREKYRMAVCSNARRETVDLCMEKMQIGPFFEFTISNDDIKRPKPAPEIYNKAIKRLGIKPSQTLVLEDNPYGIAAATASGAYVMKIDDIAKVNQKDVFAEIEKIKQGIYG